MTRLHAGFRAFDRVQALVSPEAALRRATALAADGQHGKAFALYARAARTGLAEAEYKVGRSYLEAAGVPRSRVEGIRWLERAADPTSGPTSGGGHVEAQSLLAALYLHGLGGPGDPGAAASGADRGLFAGNETQAPDFLIAARWARMAAQAGSADGQAVLAYILTAGPEPMRDLAQAHDWYKRSADAGCPQGALGFALSLARDAPDDKVGGEPTHRLVAEYLGRAAEAGLPTALYLLGVLHERGAGVKCDPAAAAQLYRRAAEKANRSGQARWGLALMQGIGVDANPTEGESWLRRAALAGDPEAAALVGDLYAKGGALPPNYAEAAIWMRRAAEAGHSGAARTLGLLHLTGAGVAPAPEEAARWFRVAGEAGDKHAQADLANLVLKGVGGTEDLVRTRQWFEQAAAGGDLVAAFNYGVCLAQGVGVPKDEKQAAIWLRRAAERVVNAQYWYGRMLIEGRGVDQDLRQGREWIARAAEVGMLDAQVALADMLLTGSGGPRDHAAALELFEKTAAKGHVEANFAVGAMLGGGHDVPTDRVRAQSWFRQAAERGHPVAQRMLGSLSAGHSRRPSMRRQPRRRGTCIRRWPGRMETVACRPRWARRTERAQQPHSLRRRRMHCRRSARRPACPAARS